MNDPDPKAVATVALVAVRLHTDADVTLKGRAIAEFTLPKEQIGGRGFAVQLYHEQENKHKRTDTFFGSYGKSSLNGNTLRFELDVPELPVKKARSGCSCSTATNSPKHHRRPALRHLHQHRQQHHRHPAHRHPQRRPHRSQRRRHPPHQRHPRRQ